MRIVLAGELDVYSVEHVRPVIDGERAKHPGTVVLDLSAVEFVDSHALHLFVEAHRGLAADGCDVSFVRPPDHVWRVFTLTGLDEVFVVRPET